MKDRPSITSYIDFDGVTSKLKPLDSLTEEQKENIEHIKYKNGEWEITLKRDPVFEDKLEALGKELFACFKEDFLDKIEGRRL